MLRSFIRFGWLVAVLLALSQANAFSLLGPYGIDANGVVWQVLDIGYNEPGDIGGPMNAAAGEEYRWNTPNIFYAYDAAFLNFFGTRGVQEIEKAIKIVNDLPAASILNVDDYPMTAERIHFRAAALGLLDLKSATLKTILEEMGLASPNRWVYTIRNRIPNPNARFPVVFTIIRRNFDPITAAESPYINGRLWTYVDIVDPEPRTLPPGSFTINTTVDPLDFGRFDPVAAAFDNAGFGLGSFFTGLTRDDVGAIKFIYQAPNWNFENAVTNGTATGSFSPSAGSVSAGGGPWTIPAPNTNNLANTNVVVSTNLLQFDPSLRFGVDKLNFVRSQYDSIVGQFLDPITNVFTEFVVTNGTVFQQRVQRVITEPDILFSAEDLNDVAQPAGIPAGFLVRTITMGWQNDDAIGRTRASHSGPGVIEPPIQIAFNNVGFINVDIVFGPFGNPVFGLNVFPWILWGAFDGTTNEPVIFSQGGNVTLEQLEQLRRGR